MGIQMAAVAAGGAVAKNLRGREWGIAKAINVSDAGKKSCMLQGKPETFDGFIMHLDEVIKLPENTEVLAGKMEFLYHDPDNERLREQLDVGDDILKETIKEQELRNWITYIKNL